MPAIQRRSLQSKAGITIRTRKGASVLPETSPQNAVAFGADNLTAGNGTNFLAAPGAGFAWIITSLVVTSDAASGYGVRVTFTGGLAALFQSIVGGTVPPGQSLIAGPFAVAANTAFGCGSTLIGAGPVHYSVSGTAYKATVASIFNPQATQVIGVPIDSDPSADLG